MLEQFSSWLTYSVLGLSQGTQLASAAEFFIYDSIKIILLLAVIVFLAALLRTFITREKVQSILGKKKEGAGNLMAAILGIPIPFCSCSAVPLFIGFIDAGVPLGITFSFLVASPLINEVAIGLLLATFGWQIALLYILCGLAIATIAGIIIGRLNLEGELEKLPNQSCACACACKKKQSQKPKKPTWASRINSSISESKSITLGVLPYVLVAIAIGSLMHSYIPNDFLSQIAGKNNLFAVPIAVLIGIPLYSNAAGVLPIIGVLVSKGVPMGTALAFMMSVIGLSFPEMVILRKVLKPKLIAIFAFILFISFAIVGYLFNFLLG
ncbi:MAG: permease [Candidatus Micrarchaeia archaeon]